MHKILGQLKKIKIIDLILLIVGLLLVFYAFSLFRRKKQTVFVELTSARSNWSSELIPPESWQSANIVEGVVVYDSMGREIAKIVEVDKMPWNGGVRSYIDLVLEIETFSDQRTHKYVLNGKPLLIGDDFTFELENTLFEGKIKNIYLNKEDRYQAYTQARAEIVVLYRGYEEWHAESLRNLEFIDEEGNVLIKTKNIEIRPAEVAVETDDGFLRRSFHPFRKDILITLELDDVLCLDGVCNFQNQNLLIGSEFWADSGSIYLVGGSIKEVKIIHD